MNRCKWCNPNNRLYILYHDTEWGHPQFDDAHLFEMLLLESFQAGLSWECVLNKRDAFRRAFDGFAPERIAAYEEETLTALASDASIIRNKRKIRAAVRNARIFLELQKEYGSFLNYLKQFWDGKTVYDCTSTTSALSDAISADLRTRGMQFMGSTIVHAFLQAVGIVYAHDACCDLYRPQAPQKLISPVPCANTPPNKP